MTSLWPVEVTSLAVVFILDPIFLPHCAVEEAYTNNILVCYNKASTIRWHRQLQLLLNSQKHTQCSKTIVQVRYYGAPKCFTNPCASNTNEGEIKPRCRWAAIRSASCCNQPFLSASLLTENPTDFLGGPASAERKERNMHMSFGLRTSHLCKLLVYLLLQRAVGSLM